MVSVVGVVTAVTSAITCAVVSVLLDVLLFLAQEMTVRLKRNIERMMSRYFTWFPISGLGEPNIYHNSGYFTRMWEGNGGSLTL